MKKLFLTGAFVAIAAIVLCQAPQAFNYQAILRNSDGTIKANETVSLQISIVDQADSSAYLEVHNTATSEFGLVNLIIGEGTTSDNLSLVDWESGPYFIELTVNGTLMGSNLLLSVPYALHAKTAKNATLLESKVIAMEEMLIDAGLYTLIDDRDGIKYKTVKIGDQIWMAENLKYLPSVDSIATGSRTNPNYYVYGYDGTVVADAKASANYTTYGVLYNWPAAMNGASSSDSHTSGIQDVCPAGWHLPSDAEWAELSDYLGGENEAGAKLKETGETHWSSPNLGATNETGFTALPGGYRNPTDYFDYIGKTGHWWSSTDYDTYNAWRWYLDYRFTGFYRDYHDRESSYSIRCVKD